MSTKLNINAISDNSIPLSKLVQEDIAGLSSVDNSIIVPENLEIIDSETEAGKVYFGYYNNPTNGSNNTGFFVNMDGALVGPVPLDTNTMMEFEIEDGKVVENDMSAITNVLFNVVADTTSAVLTRVHIDGEQYDGISYITFLGTSAGSNMGHYFKFKSLGEGRILEVSFESFGGNAASFQDTRNVTVTFTEPESIDLSDYAKLSDIPSHDNFVTKEELKKSELGSVRVLLTDEGFAPITQDVENGFYYGITERNEIGIFMKMGDALLQIPDSTRLTIEVTGTDELGYAILTEESEAKIQELFSFTNMTSPTFTVPACFVNYPHTGVSQTYISGMAFVCYDNNIEKHVLYFHGITEDGSIVNVTAKSGSNTGSVRMSVSIEQPATKTEVQEIVTSMSENELVVSAALADLNERFDELQGGSATQTQIVELQQTIQTLQTEIANIKAELVKTLNVE